MSALYFLDLSVFQWLDGTERSPMLLVWFGVFAAKFVIYFIPVHLLVLWFYGGLEERKTVVTAVLSMVVCCVIAFLIGALFARPRPFAAHIGIALINHRANASFPSDHALIFFNYVMCLFLLRYRMAAIVGLILAIITCWGRVFVGVHYPSDILGGIVIGVIVAYLCVRIIPQRIPRVILTIPPLGWPNYRH